MGRSLGWGLGGAVLISGSVLFFALAVLRLLQAETTVFDDRLSWLAYLIVVVVLAGIVGLAAVGVSRSRRKGAASATVTSHPKGSAP
jgi:multidrug transporter EmrE-like cation transporter